MAQKIWRWKPDCAYCATPLSFLDEWQPILSLQAFSVYMAIARLTWGYKKDSDVIAHSVLRKRTGLPDKSVRRGINELREHGLLKTEGPERHPLTYRLIKKRRIAEAGAVTLTAGIALVRSI